MEEFEESYGLGGITSFKNWQWLGAGIAQSV
jgi:hypothetical protein